MIRFFFFFLFLSSSFFPLLSWQGSELLYDWYRHSHCRLLDGCRGYLCVHSLSGDVIIFFFFPFFLFLSKGFNSLTKLHTAISSTDLCALHHHFLLKLFEWEAWIYTDGQKAADCLQDPRVCLLQTIHRVGWQCNNTQHRLFLLLLLLLSYHKRIRCACGYKSPFIFPYFFLVLFFIIIIISSSFLSILLHCPDIMYGVAGRGDTAKSISPQ